MMRFRMLCKLRDVIYAILIFYLFMNYNSQKNEFTKRILECMPYEDEHSEMIHNEAQSLVNI